MQNEKDVNETVAHLMKILSVPRLNGTKALASTRKQLTDWLSANHIPHRLHEYRLFAYFMEIGGLWLLISQLLLAASIWFRLGWVSIVIAVVGIVVSVMETSGIHLLSRIVSTKGENIVLEFEPQGDVTNEIILSAHYDSKTELFNDRWRTFFGGKLPVAMGLSLLLGLLGPVDAMLRNSAENTANIIHLIALVITAIQLVLFVPISLNFMFGRFAAPSRGSVDNGAACTILLQVADRLAHTDHMLKKTKVTITLFSGEEVVVQGSRAYVASRAFPHPTVSLNLELMGQDGAYAVWKTVGSPFQSFSADSELNRWLEDLIVEKTGGTLTYLNGPAGTDSYPFAAVGIPATSLASADSEIGFRGLHTPKDNPDRIVPAKLIESVELILGLLNNVDNVNAVETALM